MTQTDSRPFDSPSEAASAPGPRRPGNPARWLLDLFSSVRLGVVLLSLLFIYCAVGSVGVWAPGHFRIALTANWVHEIQWFIPWTQFHIRQAPGMEMTEFEWFHWWPFNVLIALICINLIVATLRRIRLNLVNLGVWMIHSGIIILAVGSVMYFATKLEGDAPIVRRQIVVQAPGHEPVTFAAMPGNRQTVQAGGREYVFQVMDIDPDWELLTGEHAGQRAYKVSVAVQAPGHQFVRDLIAGHPEYTQDLIWTGDAEQPIVRAAVEIGRPLVDESLEMHLEFHPADTFYLMDSSALYVREKGQREWVERPIRNLPRYNDYIGAYNDIWPIADAYYDPPLRPLHIEVPAADAAADPLGDAPLAVTGFLHYAMIESRRQAGGERLDPAVSVLLRSERGEAVHTEEYQLIANDPEQNAVEDGLMRFIWVDEEDEVERLKDIRPPRLRVRISGHGFEAAVDARPAAEPVAPFREIGATGYSYRVESTQEGLNLGGRIGEVSVAIVHVRTPDGEFRRWVFDHEDVPARDFAIDAAAGMHGQEIETDDRISMLYVPGRRPAPVTLIAGPGEGDLRALLVIGPSEPSLQRLRPGQPVTLQPGITLEVVAYASRTWSESRPAIIPPHRRERGVRQERSLLRAALPTEDGEVTEVWLPYHRYPFTERNEVLRRFPFQPRELTLPDGRVIELLYSRQRRPLPVPIALEDFIVSTHIGGFTGQTSSIRDWTSMVRFDAGNGWTDPEPISVNAPASYGGFWYFQSFWDPPDRPRFEGDAPSRGLNYTILGVGNRNGVYVQLVGCILAVMGMIYAFYMKPLIKRRRQQAVHAALNGGANESNVTTAAGAEMEKPE